MSDYALIMAGGEGTRLRPLSTADRPKQFIPIDGKTSLLQQTWERVTPICGSSRVLVATNDRYVELVHEQLPNVGSEQVIGESQKKNTAPCIALSAWILAHRDPQAVMGVFSADHYIGETERFRTLVRLAMAAARETSQLIVFGVPPASPSPDYGYIERGEPYGKTGVDLYRVARFIEKPTVEVAQEYCDAGRFLWNSGLFVWKAAAVLEEIKAHLPKMHSLLRSIPVNNSRIAEADLRRFFDEVESISIDYGVLERSQRTLVVELNVPWSDLGSFDAIRRLAKTGHIHPSSEVAAHCGLAGN